MNGCEKCKIHPWCETHEATYCCHPCEAHDVNAERDRCANIVEGWGQFEWTEGGTTFCIGCNQALRVAKAIREPEYAAEVEKVRMEYMAEKRLRVTIE